MAIDGINGVAAQITGAIRQAARSTGMSFEYLLTTAKIESSLNPAAQAVSSTARGLYQFIDQTWLATIKTTGAALGYGRYADAIVQNGAGQYEVPDAAARNAIMRLRTDPAASALMADRRQSSLTGLQHLW
jgi:soluble lytic murein transglycosylase-like protein